mmetsp:Transcript_58118/g.155351  ORF Transcript_58118/g.155351 Transcript_58118/m.155351 type:complete len:206 (-) Transcript_58118:346-963(-)
MRSIKQSCEGPRHVHPLAPRSARRGAGCDCGVLQRPLGFCQSRAGPQHVHGSAPVSGGMCNPTPGSLYGAAAAPLGQHLERQHPAAQAVGDHGVLQPPTIAAQGPDYAAHAHSEDTAEPGSQTRAPASAAARGRARAPQPAAGADRHPRGRRHAGRPTGNPGVEEDGAIFRDPCSVSPWVAGGGHGGAHCAVEGGSVDSQRAGCP